MRFHYWKSLLLTFIVAFMIWMTFATMLPIDPLTLARSQNREATQYLTEALTQIKDGRTSMNPNVPVWVYKAQECIDGALIVIGDQAANLKKVADAKLGPDMQTVGASLASIFAIFGTLSTIILSWRKDIRDAQREIQQLQIQASKSELTENRS